MVYVNDVDKKVSTRKSELCEKEEQNIEFLLVVRMALNGDNSMEQLKEEEEVVFD